MTNPEAPNHPFTRQSESELRTLMELTNARVYDRETTTVEQLRIALEQVEQIKAELKFRSQCSAAEKLAEAHYDHDRDEHNEPVTWAVAIDAMGADLLALDVPAELVLRHAARMCQMVGIEAAATDAAPSYTQRSFDKKAAEINRLY